MAVFALEIVSYDFILYRCDLLHGNATYLIYRMNDNSYNNNNNKNYNIL